MPTFRRTAVALTSAAAAPAGVGASWTLRPEASGTARAATAYTCPMHPQYRTDRPGDRPPCGMRLEPVGTAGGDAVSAAGRALPTGAVRVNAARQQAVTVQASVAAGLSSQRGGPHVLFLRRTAQARVRRTGREMVNA